VGSTTPAAVFVNEHHPSLVTWCSYVSWERLQLVRSFHVEEVWDLVRTQVLDHEHRAVKRRVRRWSDEV